MRELLRVGTLVAPKTFPYIECKSTFCEGLPRLLGRAEANAVIARREPDGSTTEVTLRLLLDGYTAPLSAGNFVDLAKRGYFNGLPLSLESDRLPPSLVASKSVLSSGQPALLEGSSSNITGFVDPRTGSYRKIPLELFPEGYTEAVYPEKVGEPLPPPRADDPTDDKQPTDKEPGIRPPRRVPMRMPFCAAGSLGMVHSKNDARDASSEFFMLTRDVSPLSNESELLDGIYTLFGFVIEGVELLPTLKTSDTVVSVNGAPALLFRRDLHESHGTRWPDEQAAGKRGAL